ncbi:dioxygenase family protein [Novosphingobium rosa]|uniref:dioxygenase family protein n=1 Tax=Novosphingobium rosa TaxID=76978 RepID=UPI00082D17AD|nr:intradiol ring-cleavage dioxygenase [Novosphingobium rosa]
MRDSDRDEDHAHGLMSDLPAFEKLTLGRRRALMWFASAGTMATVAACGDGSGSSSSSSSSSSASSSSSSASSAASSASSSASSSSGSCVADSVETNGPYPADGTNTSAGATSNVLTVSGVVRSDIRSSFISSTTTASGVQVTLTLTLVNVNSSCAPISGAAIYVWHCDASGRYSLYSSGVTTESYLRGVQVTDANGQVTFTTIYPACYSGRWPHIHFEVFLNGLGTSPKGTTSSLISQLAMPAAINTVIFNGDSRYSASISNYSAISLSSDNVFGDNSAAVLAQQTPTMSGSIASGYTATATIGIAV